MAAITAETTSGARPLTKAAHGERSMRSLVFFIALWLCLAFGILVLVVLIVNTFIEGRARIDTGLFTNYTSQIAPETAGARAAILGTAWVIGVTALLAIPLGVAAASYLEEFASKKSRFAHFVELNVQNLAAVPAIIYGMLAAAAVVAIGIPRNTVIAGGIALALLILPVDHHLHPRGGARRAAGDPARLAGPGRHPDADPAAPDPAGGDPRHRDRHDPGAVPGHG